MSYASFEIVVNVCHNDVLYQSSNANVLVKLNRNPEFLEKLGTQLSNLDFRANVAELVGPYIENDCLKTLKSLDENATEKDQIVSFRILENTLKGLSLEEAKASNYVYFIVLSGGRQHGGRGNVEYSLSFDNKVLREQLFD